MPKSIMVLNPWGVDYMDEVTKQIIQPFVGRETTLAVSNLGDAAPRVPWPSGDIEEPMIKKVCEAAGEGYDAVVIGCAADPFVSAIRAASPIPVVGVTESVCMEMRSKKSVGVIKRQLNDSYLSLIPAQANTTFWPDKLHGYGIDRGVVNVRTVRIPHHPEPDALMAMTDDDPARLCNAILDAMTDAFVGEGLREAQLSVKDDGAQALFFACTFWSRPIAESAAELEELLGVPVINPLLCAVARAEHLLDA
jgi:Asp/Glu/hydantoin racemase